MVQIGQFTQYFSFLLLFNYLNTLESSHSINILISIVPFFKLIIDLFFSVVYWLFPSTVSHPFSLVLIHKFHRGNQRGSRFAHQFFFCLF